ncbi:MAG: PIN domain nuclease [Bacteroidota bacterium]
MKMVVDTSVWINYFNGINSPKTDLLHNALDQYGIIVGDIILLEILQGIRDDKQFRLTKSLLEATILVQMINPELAIEYANHYRILRKKGVTIRKSNDIIIAGYCIKNNVPLLQQDRDFIPYADFFGLELL